ncbi:hypothetical protein B0O99DRAFT_307531 [Bisporella sp. PMI_857]|nr:hypothetical protein B0O99DRAFT_307531 [Bisporella sp. PMI_857]
MQDHAQYVNTSHVAALRQLKILFFHQGAQCGKSGVAYPSKKWGQDQGLAGVLLGIPTSYLLCTVQSVLQSTINFPTPPLFVVTTTTHTPFLARTHSTVASKNFSRLSRSGKAHLDAMTRISAAAPRVHLLDSDRGERGTSSRQVATPRQLTPSQTRPIFHYMDNLLPSTIRSTSQP